MKPSILHTYVHRGTIFSNIYLYVSYHTEPLKSIFHSLSIYIYMCIIHWPKHAICMDSISRYLTCQDIVFCSWVYRTQLWICYYIIVSTYTSVWDWGMNCSGIVACEGSILLSAGNCCTVFAVFLSCLLLQILRWEI